MGKITKLKGGEGSTQHTNASFDLESFLASQNNMGGLSNAIFASKVLSRLVSELQTPSSAQKARKELGNESPPMP